MLTLSIEKRDGKKKNAVLRENLMLPAVFYGPKEASTSISVSTNDFKKVWKQAGESSVVILKDAAGNEFESLIHEVDVHPVNGEPRHVDFYIIEKGKKVEVAVTLSFVGVSPAVKDKGGILVKVQRDIKIEAAPRDLPREIEVDISKLIELNDTIQAKDLVLPKGVELKVVPDEVVASVAEAKEEVVEAPAAIDMSAIEVEAKGKEAKEGEAPADGKGEGKTDAKADGKKAPEGKK
ncbi:MAG: 50S ribosomal protein L25 [Candidatus Paceibacterota bacterium]